MEFCPHDLFVNTRADLGPCNRIHDDEAKRLYAEAKPSARKRQYEDEFLRFCNVMLNDVDRKIQKGKQRLMLMRRDQPNTPQSKFQEQLNNLNARIQKLVSEAEEAGIRGDVDQAQDLMILCEQLKEERDGMLVQQEQLAATKLKTTLQSEQDDASRSPSSSSNNVADGSKSPNSTDGTADVAGEKKPNLVAGWPHDHAAEKQMEVCEVCGAFLIVGDAQQRIEDHLMGKQHLGYSRLRKAIEEMYARRKAAAARDGNDDDDDREHDRRRRDDRSDRRRFLLIYYL